MSCSIAMIETPSVARFQSSVGGSVARLMRRVRGSARSPRQPAAAQASSASAAAAIRTPIAAIR